MDKLCHHCGQPVTGRVDKKFCNDACRIAFHNHRTSTNYFVKQVNRAISKNRRIIRELLEKGINSLPKSELEYYGFSFKGLTGIDNSGNGGLRMLCYEFRIQPGDGEFLLSEEKPVYNLKAGEPQ